MLGVQGEPKEQKMGHSMSGMAKNSSIRGQRGRKHARVVNKGEQSEVRQPTTRAATYRQHPGWLGRRQWWPCPHRQTESEERVHRHSNGEDEKEVSHSQGRCLAWSHQTTFSPSPHQPTAQQAMASTASHYRIELRRTHLKLLFGRAAFRVVDGVHDGAKVVVDTFRRLGRRQEVC